MIVKSIKNATLLLVIIAGLSACGGGGGSTDNTDEPKKTDSNWNTMTWDKNNWS